MPYSYLCGLPPHVEGIQQFTSCDKRSLTRKYSLFYPASSTYLFSRSTTLFCPVHQPLHVNLSTYCCAILLALRIHQSLSYYNAICHVQFMYLFLATHYYIVPITFRPLIHSPSRSTHSPSLPTSLTPLHSLSYPSRTH